MKKLLNGELIDLTVAEISERETEEAQALTERQAKIDLNTDKETKKASGKQKLKDLGLDDDEIKALMGA
jgi:hypothetical protein